MADTSGRTCVRALMRTDYSLITGKIVTAGWPSPHRPMNSLDYAKNHDRSARMVRGLAPLVIGRAVV
jgi:hypothetical protein